MEIGDIYFVAQSFKKGNPNLCAASLCALGTHPPNNVIERFNSLYPCVGVFCRRQFHTDAGLRTYSYVQYSMV